MPRRGEYPYLPDQDRGHPGPRPGEVAPDMDALVNMLEHVRKGTRQQYESEWVVLLKPVGSGQTTTHTFYHELGEIPWAVDILQSEESDGRLPRELQTDSYITFTKDEEKIVLTRTYNASQNDRDLYFLVRAL